MVRFIMATKIKSIEQLQVVLESLMPLEETKIEVTADSYLIARIHPNVIPRAWICENTLSGCAKVFDSIELIELIDEKVIALMYENKRVGFIEL